MAFQLPRSARVREGTGRSVSLGKAWIFLERRSQQPHSSDARTLHPTPFTKHTREAQQSVPPAGVPTNRRREEPAESTKFSFKKVNSPGARDAVRRGPTSGSPPPPRAAQGRHSARCAAERAGGGRGLLATPGTRCTVRPEESREG